jgi:DNA-binding transcriptional regulator GbsR (MarR family)
LLLFCHTLWKPTLCRHRTCPLHFQFHSLVTTLTQTQMEKDVCELKIEFCRLEQSFQEIEEKQNDLHEKMKDLATRLDDQKAMTEWLLKPHPLTKIESQEKCSTPSTK